MIRYPLRATLVKRVSQDGLVEMHDHVPLGTVYWILGPPRIEPWKNLPTGRIIPRVSVPVQRAVAEITPDVEMLMPLELLGMADPHVAAALLLDGLKFP